MYYHSLLHLKLYVIAYVNALLLKVPASLCLPRTYGHSGGKKRGGDKLKDKRTYTHYQCIIDAS